MKKDVRKLPTKKQRKKVTEKPNSKKNNKYVSANKKSFTIFGSTKNSIRKNKDKKTKPKNKQNNKV
jgi:hypothetical protein